MYINYYRMRNRSKNGLKKYVFIGLTQGIKVNLFS